MDIVCEAGNDFTLGLRLQQRDRKIGDGLLCIGLVLAPAFAVQPVKLHRFALDADITREEMCVRGGHVKFRAFGVLDGEDLAAFAVHEDFG